MRQAARRYTRGSGLLENFLAQQRAAQADALIADELRQGRILDVGCGTTPLFLLNTRFHEKHGIDPEIKDASEWAGISLHPVVIEKDSRLPFSDAAFSVIVSLGAVEHFDEDVWAYLLCEAYRLLAPGGRLILTTPSPWTYGLLKVMAYLNMISPQEIRDARHVRSTAVLVRSLVNAGFKKENISFGTFQSGVNRWFSVLK